MLFKKNPILGCAIGLSVLSGLATAAESVVVTVGVTQCTTCASNLGGGIWGIEVYSTDEAVTIVSSGSSIDIAYIDVISEGDGVVTLTVSGRVASEGRHQSAASARLVRATDAPDDR